MLGIHVSVVESSFDAILVEYFRKCFCVLLWKAVDNSYRKLLVEENQKVVYLYTQVTVIGETDIQSLETITAT